MISYYDLLRMIKEGNIPKKVKHKNRIYKWTENSYYYNDDNFDALLDMFDDKDMFKNNIEIIEEYKYIEKIEIDTGYKIIELKINELIDEINKIRKEIDKDD